MKKKWINVILAGVFIGVMLSGCGKKVPETVANSQEAVEHSDKKEETASKKSEKEPEILTLSNGEILDFPYVDNNLGFQMMVLRKARYGMPIDSNLRFDYGGTDSNPECEFMIGPYKYDSIFGDDNEMCNLDAIKGPEDILDNMAYKIPKCFEIGIYDLQSITKDSKEKFTIGKKFEGVKWKGEITCSTSSTPDTFAYVAYGFIGSDGRPYLFAGTDFTKERKQMAFLEEAWDAMLSTFVENPLPEGASLTEDKTFRNGEWKNY